MSSSWTFAPPAAADVPVLRHIPAHPAYHRSHPPSFVDATTARSDSAKKSSREHFADDVDAMAVTRAREMFTSVVQHIDLIDAVRQENVFAVRLLVDDLLQRVMRQPVAPNAPFCTRHAARDARVDTPAANIDASVNESMQKVIYALYAAITQRSDIIADAILDRCSVAILQSIRDASYPMPMSVSHTRHLYTFSVNDDLLCRAVECRAHRVLEVLVYKYGFHPVSSAPYVKIIAEHENNDMLSVLTSSSNVDALIADSDILLRTAIDCGNEIALDELAFSGARASLDTLKFAVLRDLSDSGLNVIVNVLDVKSTTEDNTQTTRPSPKEKRNKNDDVIAVDHELEDDACSSWVPQETAVAHLCPALSSNFGPVGTGFAPALSKRHVTVKEILLLCIANAKPLQIIRTLIDDVQGFEVGREWDDLVLYAAIQGNVEVLRELMTEYVSCIVRDPQESYDKALIGAITHKKWATAHVLLSNGANPRAYDDAPVNVLASHIYDSCASSDALQGLVLLVAYGANVNARDGVLLRSVAIVGNMAILNLLLAVDTLDVNAKEGEALDWACYRGDVLMVRSLLLAYANPNVKGGKPLVIASSQGHFESVRHLLENGASTMVDTSYAFAAHHATEGAEGAEGAAEGWWRPTTPRTSTQHQRQLTKDGHLFKKRKPPLASLDAYSPFSGKWNGDLAWVVAIEKGRIDIASLLERYRARESALRLNVCSGTAVPGTTTVV